MLVYACLLALATCSLAQTEVETAYGTVRGVRFENKGRMYDNFFGIPFAAPPVGNLRWHKPQPLEPWEGVLEADEYSAHCTQIVAVGYPLLGMSNETSEDCLYLNIHVPNGVENAQDLPVMVFYYGGGYILGTAAMYPGEELALHGDVIVVTFNYRVSSLGGLSTGDEISPGNYHMWDAWAAVSWVKENVAAFGGDPEKITIFGQSAGAAMVSHSTITPHMEGLFQRAIPVSGGSSGFFGVSYNVSARESTKMLGRIFRCQDDGDMQIIFDCLMEEEAEALDFWGVVGVVLFRRQLPGWMPVVDGDLLLQHPRDSFEAGIAGHVDFMSGHTHDDAAGFVLFDVLGDGSDFANNGGWAANNNTLDFALRFILSVYGNPDELMDILYDEFPELLSEDNDTRIIGTSDMLTDWWFGSSAHYETAMHSRDTDRNTYSYDFHYSQSFLNHPSWVEGSHMDDIYSFLGEPFMEVWREDFLGGEFNDADKATRDNVMSFYTNFAHTGDPNNGPNEVPLFWPTYNEESREYMVLNDAPSVAVETEEMVDKYEFWTEEWPNLVEEPGEDDIQAPTLPPRPTLPPLPTLPIPPEMDWQTFEKVLEGGVLKARVLLKAMFGQDPDIAKDIDNYIDKVVAQRDSSIANRVPY